MGEIGKMGKMGQFLLHPPHLGHFPTSLTPHSSTLVELTLLAKSQQTVVLSVLNDRYDELPTVERGNLNLLE